MVLICEDCMKNLSYSDRNKSDNRMYVDMNDNIIELRKVSGFCNMECYSSSHLRKVTDVFDIPIGRIKGSREPMYYIRMKM